MTTTRTTTVYLLRHAESVPSADIPERDWPLSDTGRDQAERLIEVLRPLSIARVYSSPYLRAGETVRPFCERHCIPVEVRDDLRERKLADGFLANWEDTVRRSWDDLSFSLPNSESGHACQKRVVRCILEIVSENKGGVCLVSSHGNAIGLFLKSIDGAFGYKEWAAMRTPDLFRIRHGPDGFEWDRRFACKI